MAGSGWARRIAPVFASVAIYWVVCLALILCYYPTAAGDAGFPGAPGTYLAIGLLGPFMQWGDGFGIGLPLTLLFLAGIALVIASAISVAVGGRLGWAMLPGLGCLGLVGAALFSPGAI
jgi:hypothetical protein